ncbi:MAG: hypothetical protein U0U70_06250 [Chitinophagaceae bacterium]
MKKIIMLILFAAAGLTLHAQNASWKEMHSFHDVMSAVFHPSEDNNLRPLRDSASVLLMRAKEWKSSQVPEGYNSEMTKPVLSRLVTECKAIRTAVSHNKSDAELKLMIAKAHDTFHEIMEKCRN